MCTSTITNSTSPLRCAHIPECPVPPHLATHNSILILAGCKACKVKDCATYSYRVAYDLFDQLIVCGRTLYINKYKIETALLPDLVTALEHHVGVMPNATCPVVMQEVQMSLWRQQLDSQLRESNLRDIDVSMCK